MSNQYSLNAEVREDAGKGASRRLRRRERIPAIIYGGNEAPRMISLELREIRKALEDETFYSQVLTLNLEGSSVSAILRDLQRNPVNGFPTHADFQRVDASHKINVTVPLHFINEEKCVGVKQQGGEIQRNIAEVEVSCLPKDLPGVIEVDMEHVELEQVIHLSDLKLPKGVELVQLALNHDVPVVAVHKPKVRGGEEAGEGAEGE